MKSPIGAEIKKDEKSKYFWVDDPKYDKQQCPFCGSKNYGGGGSWSTDGCLDCGAIHWFGMWFKDFSDKNSEVSTEASDARKEDKRTTAT